MNLRKLRICAFHFLCERVKVLIICVAALSWSSSAHAASLQACWDTASVTPDMATVALLADSSPILVLATNVLPGTPTTGGRSCAVVPFPATLTRGLDHAITLRAMNALGEVGPASVPVTFRPPNVPGQLTNPSISALAGP